MCHCGVSGSRVLLRMPTCVSSIAWQLRLSILQNPCWTALLLASTSMFAMPPAAGLHRELADCSKIALRVLYAGMPLASDSHRQLRKHGDALVRLPNGYYMAQGRTDDTMNLGGIKVGTSLPPLLQPLTCKCLH